MLPLTGEGVGGEKRDGKSHILKQSKPFQCACGVVPRYLDALFAGPGQNTAVEPRCQNRPEALKPENTPLIPASGSKDRRTPGTQCAA